MIYYVFFQFLIQDIVVYLDLFNFEKKKKMVWFNKYNLYYSKIFVFICFTNIVFLELYFKIG